MVSTLFNGINTKLFVILFLSIVINGCSHNDLEKVKIINSKDFLKEEVLTSDILTLPTEVLTISNFIVIDSLLIINQDRDDIVFSILQIQSKSLSHLKSFGRKGNGPNEFNLSFPNTTLQPVYDTKSSFAIGNKMSNVQYYKVEELLSDIETPYKIAKLSPSLNGYRAIAYFSNSLIVGAPYGSGTDLFRYNLKDDSLNKFLPYPIDYPLIAGDQKREIYGCYIAIHPNNKKYVRTFSNEGKIEIFDTYDDKPYTLKYSGFPTLKKNLRLTSGSRHVESNLDQKLFSWDIEASENYIYVSVYNDLHQNVAGKMGPNESYIPEIHVFDWSGNPVSKLILDSHFVSFRVDKKGNYLYTTNMYEQDKIRRYKLK